VGNIQNLMSVATPQPPFFQSRHVFLNNVLLKTVFLNFLILYVQIMIRVFFMLSSCEAIESIWCFDFVYMEKLEPCSIITHFLTI